MRVAVQADCIPEFKSGNTHMTTSKWLEEVEQLAELKRWDVITRIYHMQARLRGVAKVWYNNLQSSNYSWVEWKKLIVKTYPDATDYSATLKKMLFRVKLPTETVTQYYFAKMKYQIVPLQPMTDATRSLGD